MGWRSVCAPHPSPALSPSLKNAAGESSSLTVIVNTGDDFDLWGLRVCPDLDTVMYTLAGIANPQTGWGIDGRHVRDAGHAQAARRGHLVPRG